MSTVLIMLALVAIRDEPEPTKDPCRIKVPDEGSLVCIDGKPALAQFTEIGDRKIDEDRYERYPTEQVSRDWLIRRAAKGYTLRLSSATRWYGWYLSCDPDRPEQGLFLSEMPGDGSFWSLMPPDGSRAEPIRALIPGRRWSLDYEEEGKTYLYVGLIRVLVTVRKLKLTEGDGPGFSVSVLGK